MGICFSSTLRVTALLLFFSTLTISGAHAAQPQERLSRITADEATQLAAQYVASHKLDVSRYRILPARLVESQPLLKIGAFGEGPFWLITYKIPRADGGEYFVFVSQDGKVGITCGL